MKLLLEKMEPPSSKHYGLIVKVEMMGAGDQKTFS